MVGKKRGKEYLALILIALSMAVVVAILIDQFTPGAGAAWGQLFGLMGFAWLLHCVTRTLFAHAAPEIWVSTSKLLVVSTLFIILYAWMRKQYI